MTSPLKAEYGPPQAQNHYVFDGLPQTYAYKLQTKQALERGRLSYWNPHILGGYPQYAESLANNYDVFNVLLLWLEPSETIHLQTIMELFIAGIGMLFLLRFLGVSPIVNLLFASAYMLNTMFIATTMNRWLVASFCWVPFVVLMVIRFLKYSKIVDVLYAAIFLALTFLGGNFQTSFFAAMIVLVLLLFYPSLNVERSFLSRLSTLVIIGTMAFGLSAVMWLPTLELALQTIFHGGSLRSSYSGTTYSLLNRLLSVPLLLTFFFPGIAGNAQTFNLKKFAGVDIMNFSGAIGFMPAIFGFGACFLLWKHKEMRSFIILVATGFVLPLATPLFSLFYHRIFIISSFSLCVIGAIAFQSFIDGNQSTTRFSKYLHWGYILTIICVVALFGVFILLNANYSTVYRKFADYVVNGISTSAFGIGNESWMIGRIEKTLRYYSSFSFTLWGPIIFVLVSIAALFLFEKEKISQRVLLVVSLLGSVTQLIIFAFSWYPVIDTKQFPIYPKEPVSSFLARDSSASRFVIFGKYLVDGYLMAANSADVYGIYDLNGYETFSIRSISVLSDKYPSLDSPSLRLYGLVNTKYILTSKVGLQSPNVRRLFRIDSMNVYENLLCKPRAYIVYKNRTLNTENEVEKDLIEDSFDGSEALFLSSEPHPTERPRISLCNDVKILHSNNEEVALRIETSSEGILILTDTYYPGWKCYVNEVETPIYRANYCMRAIIIPSGKSEVIFRFEPAIFSAGVNINIFFVAVSVFSLFYFKKKETVRN
jgi:hypothetical protein